MVLSAGKRRVDGYISECEADNAGHRLLGRILESGWSGGTARTKAYMADSDSWTPNKSHLAPSTYCMHTLLTTQWPGIDLIADDRCVSSPSLPASHAVCAQCRHHDT
jgi:hypothetical protein